MPSSPTFLDHVVIPKLRGTTVLDVGCGTGRWGALIASNWWESAGSPYAVDGLDIWEPVVEMCRRSGHYRNVWQQGLPGRLEGTWDTVLAAEVIEHVAQDVVEGVLEELERVARRRLIVTTPNWPYFREGHETPLGFSEHEAHLSHLGRAFFRDRGYRLESVGLTGTPQWPARTIRALRLARVLEGLPRVLPALGAQLVAYKDFD